MFGRVNQLVAACLKFKSLSKNSFLTQITILPDENQMDWFRLDFFGYCSLTSFHFSEETGVSSEPLWIRSVSLLLFIRLALRDFNLYRGSEREKNEVKDEVRWRIRIGEITNGD